MSVPRKMSEYAALYGCEIVEQSLSNADDGDAIYAQANGKKEFICHWYDVKHVDLNTLKGILQRVSGRTLAQYWTGR